MAARAARRITPDATATLTRSFEQLESLLGQPAEYNTADLEFHDAIHRIAGDRFGRAIVASIQGKALSSPMYTGRPTRAEIETTHLAHNRIYDAVIAGDADEAATAIREHITRPGPGADHERPASSGGADRHPLTAPAVTPAAIWRWKTM